MKTEPPLSAGRRRLLLGALSAPFAGRLPFSEVAAAGAAALPGAAAASIAQIAPSVAGLFQSATGVLSRQPYVYKQGRPESALRSYRDYDHFFDDALARFARDQDKKALRYASGFGSHFATYFCERLAGLTHLYFYEEKTLEALQNQPGWEHHLAPKEDSANSHIQREFDYQDKVRLGVLTHAKIADEIAHLMVRLVDLSAKLDRLDALSSSPSDREESAGPYSSLDLIVQKRTFDSWHSRPILPEYREAFARAGLSDKEKVLLLIEVIDHHEGLPNGKTAYYHERPCLSDIPPVIYECMSDYLKERRTLAETMPDKDPLFSRQSFDHRKAALLKIIDHVFEERDLSRKITMPQQTESDSSSAREGNAVPINQAARGPVSASLLPSPISWIRGVFALTSLWKKAGPAFPAVPSPDLPVEPEAAIPAASACLPYDPVTPVINVIDIAEKNKPAAEPVPRP